MCIVQMWNEPTTYKYTATYTNISIVTVLYPQTLDYLDERLDVEEDNANILELVGLLETFEDYIELHDEIISRSYYENETLPEMKVTGGSGSGTESNSNHSIYRMVGLHKNKGEPLGKEHCS